MGDASDGLADELLGADENSAAGEQEDGQPRVQPEDEIVVAHRIVQIALRHLFQRRQYFHHLALLEDGRFSS